MSSAAATERWWGNHLGELRWQAQLARLLVDPVFRGEGVPRGDGRPVVLIPGFIAGDYTLRLLGNWLRRIGYEPHHAGMRANVACMDSALDRFEQRVAEIREASGRRVAMIGHSRGGHFAKALARRHPDWVSHVVMMGAGFDRPLEVSYPIELVVHAVNTAHRRADPSLPAGCMFGDCGCRAFQDYDAPFPPEVPLTSIYTRGDGCLRYDSCIAPYAECIEVGGTHVGLAFDRRVYAVIAGLLASPEREPERE